MNIKGVNLIVHYGTPHSIDSYQESGRGGHSSDCTCSIAFWKPIDCHVKKEPACLRDRDYAYVRNYLGNTTVCHRRWLLEFFDPCTATARSGNDKLLYCDKIMYQIFRCGTIRVMVCVYACTLILHGVLQNNSASLSKSLSSNKL